jgi:hypothetical protein
MEGFRKTSVLFAWSNKLRRSSAMQELYPALDCLTLFRFPKNQALFWPESPSILD